MLYKNRDEYKTKVVLVYVCNNAEFVFVQNGYLSDIDLVPEMSKLDQVIKCQIKFFVKSSKV